jgi:hypothetical protein
MRLRMDPLWSTSWLAFFALAPATWAQPRAANSDVHMFVAAQVGSGPIQIDGKEVSQADTTNPLSVAVSVSAGVDPGARIVASGLLAADWGAVSTGTVAFALQYSFDIVASSSLLTFVPVAAWTYTFIPDVDGQFAVDCATSMSAANSQGPTPVSGNTFVIRFDGVETPVAANTPANAFVPCFAASTIAGHTHTISISPVSELGLSGSVSGLAPLTVTIDNHFQWQFSVATPETVAPFAAFSAELEVKTSRAKSEAEGQFTLGDTSDGIDATSEDVTFQIGSFSGLIPKGSFLFDPVSGAFTFGGSVGGVPVEAVIAPVRGMARTFTFEIDVKGVDAAAGANAVTIQLAIGNDNGTTSAPVESRAR